MTSKRFTKFLSGLVALLAFHQVSFAQANSSILGARLIVESPTAIAGQIDFTYSSNPTSTGPWGGALTPRIHEQVVKVSDSEGCNTVTGVSGKWALIYRGNCEFGAKALKAQQAGAIGVIIWNHTPDELVNMAAGASGGAVTIPTLFVTNQDGGAMNTQLNLGQQVFISLSPWGFNNQHDLAFVYGGIATTHGMAVPLNQFDNGNVAPYRFYTAAAVANTGASVETKVKVASNVTFTPQAGGGAVQVYRDSEVVNTFTVQDSVILINSPRSYKLTPTQTGTYDVTYTLSSNSADQYPLDNVERYSFAVTTNAFSRGRFDVANNRPVISGYSRVGTTDPWTWGPMFYNKKGGYQLQSLMFALSDRDTSRHSLVTSSAGSFIDAYVFRWKDQNNDGFMQGSELSLKGAAVQTFSINDSAKKIMNVPIGDNFGSPATIISEDSSYYWVAFNLGGDFSLSVDSRYNMYMREFAAQHGDSVSHDYWAPALRKTVGDMVGGDTIRTIPYGIVTDFTNKIDSADFTQQGTVPAVALFTSMWPVSVKSVAHAAEDVTIYPNPAVNAVNVKIALQKESDVYVKVLDVFARQVSLQHVGKMTNGTVAVDVSALAAGNYYISVIANDRVLVKPFVKSK